MRKKRVTLSVFFLSLFLILSGCSWPGLGTGSSKDTIKVGCLNTTESEITSNIVKGMIEHYTDKRVELITGLATSTVVHQAMMNDDIQVSGIRYTGTDLTGSLQLPPEKDPKKALKIVQKEFKERYNQVWYHSYGFANTYAFMVSKETAEKYNLKKISDLKPVADQLTAGVDTSWMNREGDGFKEFKETYGVNFKKVYPMQIGLVYNAVHNGKMDVVLGYSTDGRIASYDLVILEDDLHFFPPYDASPVVKQSVLDSTPGLAKAFEKLSGTIDTKTMQKLNYEADNDLIEPAIVAQRFLQEHHYFEDKGGK